MIDYKDGKLMIDLMQVPINYDVDDSQIEIKIGRFPGGTNDYPSIRVAFKTDFRAIANEETIGDRLNRGLLGG